VTEYGVRVTCANLLVRGDRKPVEAKQYDEDATAAAGRYGTVFPPWLVVDKDGVRFGFVGLLSPGTVVRQGPSSPPEAQREKTVEAVTWSIGDPAETAAKVLPEAAEKCDVLVLLAHMDLADAKSLLEAHPEVDLALVGHGQAPAASGNPERAGNALILEARSRGQTVGEMHLTVDADGNVVVDRNRVHFLDADYVDDGETLAMVEEFEESNRRKQKVLYAQEQLQATGAATAAGDYLGVATCQSCHLDAFHVYMKTAHAHAYQTLASQFVHRDTNCIGCHVTGYEEEGGYGGIRLRNASIDLVDVQCEACHGPASQHRRDGSYRAAAIASCVRCHTPHDDPDFDFARDWEKIKH
jgi:hypothetical protein